VWLAFAAGATAAGVGGGAAGGGGGGCGGGGREGGGDGGRAYEAEAERGDGANSCEFVMSCHT